jgi:glycosyltransferase 2 family protein
MRQSFRRPRFWIGLILGIAGLAITFRGIDYDVAVRSLRTAELPWVAAAAAGTIASLLCRSLRWSALFHPDRLQRRSSFAIVAVADMANAFLPIRLGEVARVQLVDEREDRSKAQGASTLIVEHVLDGLVVALLLLLTLPFIPSPNWLAPLAWAGAAAGVAVTALFALAWFKREAALEKFDQVVQRLPRRWRPKLNHMAEQVIDGFSAVRSPRAATEIMTWSILTWLSGAASMWSLLAAFGLPRSIPEAVFLVCISGLALVVPSAPGDVGVYHAALAQSLVIVYGTDRSLAASYAVLAHLLLFVPPIILGGVILGFRSDWRSDLLKLLRSSKEGDDGEDSSADD